MLLVVPSRFVEFVCVPYSSPLPIINRCKHVEVTADLPSYGQPARIRTAAQDIRNWPFFLSLRVPVHLDIAVVTQFRTY